MLSHFHHFLHFLDMLLFFLSFICSHCFASFLPVFFFFAPVILLEVKPWRNANKRLFTDIVLHIRTHKCRKQSFCFNSLFKGGGGGESVRTGERIQAFLFPSSLRTLYFYWLFTWTTKHQLEIVLSPVHKGNSWKSAWRSYMENRFQHRSQRNISHQAHSYKLLWQLREGI